jgi:hypothetical protein
MEQQQMKLIDDTAIRLARLLYPPHRMDEAMENWVIMCLAAKMRGDEDAAILIIPGPEGVSVDRHHRPEFRERWGLN